MPEFRVLTKDEARAAREGTNRKAWYQSIMEGNVIEMTARPSLSAKDKAVMDEQGLRMRTRYAHPGEDDTAVFVWVEGLDAATPDLDDDELPL